MSPAVFYMKAAGKTKGIVMFIGHLPAGYLITCTLVKRLPLIARHARWAMVIGLVGAIVMRRAINALYLVR